MSKAYRPADNGLAKDKDDHKLIIAWPNVIVIAYLHAAAFYGFLLLLGGYAKLQTLIFIPIVYWISGIGTTGGAHRLWAHKSYKANFPLRIYLAACSGLTYQNSIYEWARDHRVHHKFSETNADPHNAKRGFFFSHVGWLMVRKHRDVIEKGKTVDMSDLEQDPVVMFQKKYYWPIMIFSTFILTTVIPCYFWGESLIVAFHSATMFRYVFSVNAVWCINSAAHLWGTKPYDRNIGPVENTFMYIFGLGEGYHNYHHTFPWDYKASEMGSCPSNSTATFIEFCARQGWVTELKTASAEMIRTRANRTGDGSWYGNVDSVRQKFVDEINDHDQRGEDVWGWGDSTMTKEEINEVKVYNKFGEVQN